MNKRTRITITLLLVLGAVISIGINYFPQEEKQFSDGLYPMTHETYGYVLVNNDGVPLASAYIPEVDNGQKTNQD